MASAGVPTEWAITQTRRRSLNPRSVNSGELAPSDLCGNHRAVSWPRNTCALIRLSSAHQAQFICPMKCEETMVDVENEPLDFSMKNVLRISATAAAATDDEDYNDEPATKPTPTPSPLFNGDFFAQQLEASGLKAFPKDSSAANIFSSHIASLNFSALQQLHCQNAQTNAMNSCKMPSHLFSATEDEHKDDDSSPAKIRRERNNDAAKRSRDNRRTKQMQITMRAAVLERENTHLRAQLNVLRSEMNQLRVLLFGTLSKMD
uniref:BZIP domain-containing protein n=1 Tax=Plectus sambesii TaxID=2011161 RepID=A0A914X0D0_9BILA